MTDGSTSPIPAALDALLALVPLDVLPRTGWVLRGAAPAESVAGHLLGVGHLALALAPRVRPGLDLALVLSMALVHDAPEALTGDIPRPAAEHLPPGAKKAMENAVAATVVSPLSRPAQDAWTALQTGASPEARFVKACDVLQMGVRLLAYEAAGQGGLDEFWGSIADADLSEFPVASELRDEMMVRR